MYNHAPNNYTCPFCSLLQGYENEDVLSVASDIYYRDEHVCAMIS
jgi:histidine triad (HIT) family protein